MYIIVSIEMYAGPDNALFSYLILVGRKTMAKAFTLIELLIVVAIIGILAAIAVPNFLNAQIRAKVSRVVSDMKTIETALEMYHLDNNAYPPWRHPMSGGNRWPNSKRYQWLTSPVAYLGSIPVDPFATYSNPEDYARWGNAYDYVNTYDGQIAGWGHAWRVNSWGPDSINHWGGAREGIGKCPNGVPKFQYQSSNGLVSLGDIVWVGDKVEGNTCNIQNGI